MSDTPKTNLAEQWRAREVTEHPDSDAALLKEDRRKAVMARCNEELPDGSPEQYRKWMKSFRETYGMNFDKPKHTYRGDLKNLHPDDLLAVSNGERLVVPKLRPGKVRE